MAHITTLTRAYNDLYNSQANTYSYSGSFETFKESEVKVKLDGTLLTYNSSPSDNTQYSVNLTDKTIHVGGGNLSSGTLSIYPDTDLGAPTLKAPYTAGSAVTASDLTNNQLQVMRKALEFDENKLSAQGGTMTGHLTMGEDQTIIFEGATDNAHETTLTVTDPTADRTITLPNVTGTVVTTGDTGTVATAMIAADAITAAKIAAQTITASELAADSVTSSELVHDAVITNKIANSAVTTAKIADSNITTAKIANDAVTTAKIANSAITGTQLAADAVTGAKIAADSIDSVHYAAGSVDTTAIENNAVTGAKIGPDAVNSQHYTDGSIDTAHIADLNVTTAKIAADAITNAKIADDSIDSEHYVDGSIDTAHIAGAQVTDAKLASNSVITSKITDANVTTVKIADSNVTLAKLASDLKQTSISNSNTQIPTSGAVVSYVAAQIAPIGGLEVIADEDNFPTSQPSSGVVISISDAAGIVVQDGSGGTTAGRSTTARTAGNGSDNVTINNFPSSLHGETLATGVGLMVSSTGSSNTYNYHKILAAETDVKQLSDDINDFNARYRVGNNSDLTALANNTLDSGDLFFNTSTGKLLVYNGTNSAWEEAQSIGNYYINTISSYSGTGGNSASFNGSAYRFILSNAGATAEQHIVSVNGVIQKPNSGTSQPGEGFAIDGSSIIFSSAPATGADYFIITVGSTVNIGTPSDNTITTAKLTSGAVTTAKIADDAVTGAKIADNLDLPDGNKIRFGTGNDLSIEHDGNHSYINEQGTGDLFVQSNGGSISFQKFGTLERLANFITDGAVELFHDSSKKIETTNWGAQVSGNFVATGLIDLADGNGTSTSTIALGDSDDLLIYHNGSDSYVKNTTGDLYIRDTNGNIFIQPKTDENGIKCIADGAVELYYDNVKKFETETSGTRTHGDHNVTGEIHLTTDGQSLKIGAGADLRIFHNGTHNYVNSVNGALVFQNNGTSVAYFHDSDSHFLPWSTNTFDLGSSGNRWRNVYTNDLHLSNEGSSNNVDGTWGDWTIQEGESDLFLKNNRSGKTYKFNLTEVS